MTRPTTRCIGLAMALLLLTSAAAIAGTFEGQGRDDPKVGISFEKKRGKIKGFTFERARFYCTNSERFRAGMRAGDMELHRRNRFRDRFTDPDGKVVLRVNGKITGHRARGTLRVVAYVKSDKCTTKTLDWKARRSTRN